MSEPTATTHSDGQAGFRFAVGTRLAERYVVERGLGRGGMGEVYQVEDTQLGEQVALKVLSERLSAQPVALSRFVDEVKNARRITHPNVCRIYEFGVHGEGAAAVHFLTMELLPGETLDARMARSRLSRAEVEEVLGQVASAIDAAHAVGIVHRDLKPSNVMLVAHSGGGTRAVVTDFGLARRLDESRITREGWVGTPAYVAPEQLEGEAGGTAVDVYAFGVMLFEAVTGRLPFDSGTGPQVALQRLARPAPRARSIDPSIPEAWDEAIARCLEKDPAARFGWASDALKAMAAEVVALGGAPGPSGAGGRERTRRHRLMAGGVVGVLVVAAAMALLVRARARPQPLPASRLVAVRVAPAPGAKDPELPQEIPAFSDAAAYVIREQWTRLEDKRRFRVSPDASGNVEARLTWSPAGSGSGLAGAVELTQGGRRMARLEAEAPSIRELAIAVYPRVADVVGQGLAPVELFPEERAEMQRWGAPDVQAYKDLKAAVIEIWTENMVDNATLDARVDEVLRRFPGWPHAVLAAMTLRQPDSFAIPARQHLPLCAATEDLAGRRALESAAAFSTRSAPGTNPIGPWSDAPDLIIDVAHQQVEAVGLSGEEWGAARSLEERRMEQRYPALQWTGLASDKDQHPSWHRTAPGNRQAWLTVMARGALGTGAWIGEAMRAFALLQGDLAQTRIPLAALHLVRFDADAIGGMTPSLLELPPYLRAQALYLIADADVFTGRLQLAREKLLRSGELAANSFAPDGGDRHVLQRLRELMRLESLIGNATAAARHRDQLIVWWTRAVWPVGAAYGLRWESAYARGGACPPLSVPAGQLALSTDERDAVRLMRRAAQAAGCGACQDVVSDGPSLNEGILPWTAVYARCAVELGRSLDEALTALRAADRFAPWELYNRAEPAAVDIVLAHYWMARILEKQGKGGEAKAQYERFLQFWGQADIPIAEVDDARKRLAGLR